MAISRAFTTRRVKQSLQFTDVGDSFLQRSNTTKAAAASIRNKISGPVELIHTTNMLSYHAPDIYPKSSSPTASSAKSEDDLSDPAPTAASSPPTSPDMSQGPSSPGPDHVSYFPAPSQQPAAAAAASEKPDPPVIPQRAPSHTKRGTYESLARHRSNSRLSEQSSRTVSSKASLTFSRSSSASTSTTATSRSSTPLTPKHMSSKAIAPALPSPPTSNPAVPPPVQYHQHKKEYSESHPFGQELAQVTELAEEYGFKERLNVIDEEEQELASLNLFKFSAEDYLSEIRDLFSAFLTEARPAAVVWI